MIKIVSLSAVLFTCSSLASTLPDLPFQHSESPHKLFIASEGVQQGFDSWKIDGGYSYNVFDKVDLYIGARVDQSQVDNENELGFLSGVSYQITPRMSVKSTLHSYKDDPLAKEGQESKISAEVSSRLQLTENIDVHATLDYQEWQQGLEVGLGFRF
jgi:opacity protein-like surface antigen